MVGRSGLSFHKANLARSFAFAPNMPETIVCKRCGADIDSPTEIELAEGICLPCLNELADDVDESSPLSDSFGLADIENEERMLFKW